MARLVAEHLVKIRRDARRTVRVELDLLTLEPGEACALVAPSGAGKSTALSLLALAAQADVARTYRIEADGRTHDFAPPLAAGRKEALARLRSRFFGYAAQADNLLPFLTCLENVRLGQAFGRRGGGAEARKALKAFGVEHLAEAAPARASTGERHRVALARAVAGAPQVLIADEPTAALDPVTARDAFGVLVDHVRQTGAVLILATHDAPLARDHGVRILDYTGERDEHSGWRCRFTSFEREAA